MKLRLKYSGRRVPLEIIEEADNPPTIQKLRDNITNAIPDIDPEFELSLNGKDTLAVEPETPLSDLGIVSGDMIVVKTNQQNQPQQQQQHQPQQQQQHQPQQQLQQQQQQQLQQQQQQKQEQQSAVAQQPTSSQDTVMEDPNKASDDVPMAEFEPEDDPEAIKDELVNRYLRQPLVVSESTADELPESLHKLYTTMAPSSKSEALFLVLHVLMEETGFLAEADVLPHSLPDDWKSRGSFNMKYRHHSSSAATFKMMAIEMGPVFIVHAHGFPKGPKGSHVECSTKIKVTDYVNDVVTEPCRSYKHLALLARTFKDAVAHKILALTCQDTNLVLSLTTLPSEVQVEILQYLRAPDLLRVATVCKLLQIRVNSPCIWRRRYLLEFGRRSNSDMNQDWKRLYREKKMERQRLRQHMQRMIRPEFPWGTLPAPPLPIGPFYPPGGIGGDYDRDPFAPNLPGGMFPLGAPRPRFDPFLGPGAPPHQFRPGRGGGINDRLPGLGGLNPGGRRSGGGGMGGLGGFGPRFF